MKIPIALGEAIKATKQSDGSLLVEGCLVRYSTENDPDLCGDFFTKNTYFGPDIDGKKIPLYYHHGLQLKVTDPDTKAVKMVGPGRRKIGEGTIKADDTGLFYAAVVDASEEYLESIADIVNEGKAFYSSGAVSHVVTRKAILDENEEAVKAYEITQWLLGEGSITHSPAEPRNGVTEVGAKAFKTAIKSLDSLKPDDIVAKDFAAKGALSNYGRYSWDYQSDWDDSWSPASELSYTLHDTIGYRLVKAIRNISTDENMTPAEQEAAIRACCDEYKELMVSVTMALINAVEVEEETESKALKSFVKYVPEGEVPPTKSAKSALKTGLSLADQGKQALDGLTAYTKRLEAVKSIRVAKSSPPLSNESTKTLEEAQTLITDALKGSSATPPVPPTNDPEPNPAPGAGDDAVKSFSLSPEKIEEFKALGILND